ncbi:hypothetical protein GCM10022408_38060 [Hymenobacter fastidiosus]|uniref:Uncharacterized protein n=1 Tax=Hymenobacter fastidiosus TaxID=486264 RepID=A0ABP7T3T7_9BACT
MPVSSDTIQLLPIYVNPLGEPCDVHTHERLRLASGAMMHLLVHHPDQLLPPPEVFTPKQFKVVAADGVLTFTLNQTPWGKADVTLQFPDGLRMYQQYVDELPYCQEAVNCLITDVRAKNQPYQSVPGFSPIQAISVNNAYTEASKRYEPKRKSNTADIYHCMRTKDGWRLREAWEQHGNQ